MITIKKIITLFLFIISTNYAFAQTSKIAILDFENTSGKSEYEALGKSLSNMLITDLKNNIHPKKVEFYERVQLNKLLEEQKLQKSKNFDTKTAVDFGKLSGVNYVFVGAVFVLEGKCNITSKLVDVKTSKILITKEVNGKIESWLSLKSELAETIAKELNNPINLENEYKTVSTSLSTLNQYGKILSTMDTGDSEKAEQLRSVFEETNPDFKYFKDIKGDIETLKKQVAKNIEDIEVLNNSGGKIINPKNIEDFNHNLFWPTSSYDDRRQNLLKLLEYSPEELQHNGISINEFGENLAPFLLLNFRGNNSKSSIELHMRDLQFNLLILEHINTQFEPSIHIDGTQGFVRNKYYKIKIRDNKDEKIKALYDENPFLKLNVRSVIKFTLDRIYFEFKHYLLNNLEYSSKQNGELLDSLKSNYLISRNLNKAGQLMVGLELVYNINDTALHRFPLNYWSDFKNVFPVNYLGTLIHSLPEFRDRDITFTHYPHSNKVTFEVGNATIDCLDFLEEKIKTGELDYFSFLDLLNEIYIINSRRYQK